MEGKEGDLSRVVDAWTSWRGRSKDPRARTARTKASKLLAKRWARWVILTVMEKGKVDLLAVMRQRTRRLGGRRRGKEGCWLESPLLRELKVNERRIEWHRRGDLRKWKDQGSLVQL